MLTLKAYAKINLTMDVLGKRDDGYHEIYSVMQMIDMADTLTFKAADIITISNKNRVEITDNSVLKAAKKLKEASGIQTGAAINLVKKIPFAAGLGGGSSDAAATLRGLNALWDLNWPLEKLGKIATEVGSDVSFFLYGGTVLVKGRGEIIVPLPDFPITRIIVLKPPFNLINKTRALYEKLDEAHIYSSGRATRRLVRNFYVQGQRVSSRYICNVFEQVADKIFPELPEFKRIFQEAGASNIHLCGAGPALFTLEYDSEAAIKIYQSLISRGLEAYQTQTVSTEHKSNSARMAK